MGVVAVFPCGPRVADLVDDVDGGFAVEVRGAAGGGREPFLLLDAATREGAVLEAADALGLVDADPVVLWALEPCGRTDVGAVRGRWASRGEREAALAERGAV